MSGLLLDVPEEKPRWRELAASHGITTTKSEEHIEPWIASKYTGTGNIGGKSGHIYQEDTGATEREAVVTLIHRLKLPGWETVSLNP